MAVADKVHCHTAAKVVVDSKEPAAVVDYTFASADYSYSLAVAVTVAADIAAVDLYTTVKDTERLQGRVSAVLTVAVNSCMKEMTPAELKASHSIVRVQ